MMFYIATTLHLITFITLSYLNELIIFINREKNDRVQSIYISWSDLLMSLSFFRGEIIDLYSTIHPLW